MRGELFSGTEDWDPISFVAELKAGGYTSEGVPGISEYGALVAKIRPNGPGQEVLCRLFLAGETVAKGDLERVLERSSIGLRNLGVLEEMGLRVRSLFRLRPHKEEYYFEDFPKAMAQGDSGGGLSLSWACRRRHAFCDRLFRLSRGHGFWILVVAEGGWPWGNWGMASRWWARI